MAFLRPWVPKSTQISLRIMARQMAWLLGQHEYPCMNFAFSVSAFVPPHDLYIPLTDFSDHYLAPIARAIICMGPVKPASQHPSAYDEMHTSLSNNGEPDGMTVYVTMKPPRTQISMEIIFDVTYLCPPERLALPKELAELAEMYELS